jgi:hypothetical protein
MLFRSAIILILIIAGSASVSRSQNENPLAELRQSEIDANIPDKKDFDAILKRDLTKYVTDPRDKGITVSIELLRDQPSQSGVAFPKFYCWIEKRDAKGVIMEEAAARIAAVNKTHFDVIQYFDRKRLVAEPGVIVGVFPEDVCEKIRKKLKKDEK